MEMDQLVKQLQWLDEERRKDKLILSSLEDQVVTLAREKSELLTRLNELEGEASRYSVMSARFEQVDAAIAQVKVDFGRTIDGIEKHRSDRERESEKNRTTDYNELKKSISEVKQGLDPIEDLKNDLLSQTEEDYRLSREINDLKNTFTQFDRSDEEEKRSLRLMEENQRQDTKRIADLQAELTALRKRSDELRGKQDLNSDNMRRIEMRINEVQASEAERRQAQTAFIEKQNMLQVDRDRIWKDWQSRFAEITKQSGELNTQMQALDSMNRTLKRSQAAFDEITQTFERRVNEITELQRLVEERFRQEWVAFKADDQKRWTNYNLGQEEQHREFSRILEKHDERLVLLEDMTQEIRDMSHQVVSDIRNRMQKIASLSGDLLEEYDRTFGNIG